MTRPQISIVTSLYRSERFLEQFVEECVQVLKDVQCASYELIFVNDGSPDNSVAVLQEIKKRVSGIKIIDLSRNFGHHYAFVAGLQHAQGAYIFNIDCDLEVRPAALRNFYQIMLADEELDVVFGYQESRKGGWTEKVFGGFFWKFFNWVTDTKVPPNIVTERLMTRRYVDALRSMGDKNLFLAGMMSWVGFKQKGVQVGKEQRKGRSTYSFRKRIRLMIEAVSSFSAYPLKMLFKLGMLITLLSFLYGSFLLVKKALRPDEILPGYTSIVVAILFSTGIIVLSLGLVGIYLEKIFNQIKDRPLYIVRRIIE